MAVALHSGMSNKKLPRGVDRVAITNKDLANTLASIDDVLGYDRVGANMLAVRHGRSPQDAIRFTRVNAPGLHHLAPAIDSARIDRLRDALPARRIR